MSKKGIPLSDEHKQKISEALTGHPMYKLKERNEKISNSTKGLYIPSRYTKERNSKISKSLKGRKQSQEQKEKLSDAHKGKKQSPETVQKRVNSRKGYKHSQETKDKIKTSNQKRFINHIYKIDESKIWRNRIEYKNWRNSVFNRDNFTCQKCGLHSGGGKKTTLHPHHIINFYNNIDERFLLDNGITLCIDCHKLFHHIYGKIKNNKEQILKFIN